MLKQVNVISLYVWADAARNESGIDERAPLLIELVEYILLMDVICYGMLRTSVLQSQYSRHQPTITAESGCIIDALRAFCT